MIFSVSNNSDTSLKLPHDNVLSAFIDLIYCLVKPLGVLMYALLQRCLSKALDGSSDRASVAHLIISDGVS